MSLKVKAILTISVILLAALAISGCTSPAATPSPTAAPTATPVPTLAAGPAVLTVSGMVNTPLSLSLSDLNASTQHYATWKNNAGNASFSGTGPYVVDLLNKAGLQSGATNITFTCTDPANAISTKVTLADLNSKYNDSIVAYNWTGLNKQGATITNVNKTLQLIVPSGGGKNQVGNITQITVS